MAVERDDSWGHLESGHSLVDVAGRKWSHLDLRSAAERAELQNTGWPIGVVLTRPGLAPTPTAEGIEARLRLSESGMVEDFWSFRSDGSYYVSRVFEEDTRPVQTNVPCLYFDVRIWRIAEVLLHSAAIYRELGVAPDEPYLITVNHEGLAGRTLASSNPTRLLHQVRTCQVESASWRRTVTQENVTTDLHDLVAEIARDLFVLFDFFDPAPPVISGIVDEFLQSKT